MSCSPEKTSKVIHVTPSRTGLTRSGIFTGPSAEPRNCRHIKVEVEYGNLQVPVGSTVKALRVEHSLNEYITHAKVCAFDQEYQIESALKENEIRISTPFYELISIGNEMAIYSLIYGNALTIRCSAFAVDHTVFLFCGQSNAGKSTLISEARKRSSKILILSDDHLMIEKRHNMFYCQPPFWDSCYRDVLSDIPVRMEAIFFVLLDDPICSDIGMWDILPHIVPFNYDPTVNTFILDQINIFAMSPNSRCVYGRKRDYTYNLRMVESIVGVLS